MNVKHVVSEQAVGEWNKDLSMLGEEDASGAS